MKKTFYILFVVYYLLFVSAASAQTVNLESQIDELKDRIASRVAELKLVEKRGIIGVVAGASQTQITLTDNKNETRFVDVDELTKFDGRARDFGISDIKEGQTLGVLGLYNKQSRRLLARVITELTIPTFVNGVIEKKDEDSFTLTIVDIKDKVYIADYERSTKAFSYTKKDGLQRSGFSEIEARQNVIISFTKNNEQTRISADRIIIFPEIPKNPNIAIEVETTPIASPTATPSAR